MIPPGYLDLVRRRESGGNDFARNSLSSASGRYQFTDDTFVNTMMPLMPGKSRQEILGLKNDPAMQEQAMQAFTMGNANSLRNAGFEPTPQNLYLAHHFGAGGAAKLLRADPNTPLTQLFGPEVFKANPYLNNISDAQGLINKWSGGGGGNMNYPMQGGSQTIYPGEEQGFNISDFFGNNLVNAGAAIASISSPAAGAAIGRLAQGSDQEFQTSVNPQTGQIVRVNRRTGATQVIDAPALRQAQQAQQAAQQQQELAMYDKKLQLQKQYNTRPATDGFRKESNKYLDSSSGNIKMASEAAELFDAIDSGELDNNLLNRFKDQAFSIMGLSADQRAAMGITERQATLLGRLERYSKAATLEEQLRQNGVQTDKDFINIMTSRFDSGSLYDPIKMKDALRATVKDFANRGYTDSERYIGRSRVFPDDPELNNPAMIEIIQRNRETGQTLSKKIDDYERAGAERRSQEKQQAPKPATQTNNPSRITTKEEYDNLPSGTRFIGPDGRLREKP